MKRRTLCHGAGPAWHHGERRGARLRPHRGRGAADWRGTEERLAARAMMGRIGEPDDIANPHWKPSREPHLRSRLTVDRRERSTPGAFARPPKTRRAVELAAAEAESPSAAALRVW